MGDNNAGRLVFGTKPNYYQAPRSPGNKKECRVDYIAF